jgi:hypothetical protein
MVNTILAMYSTMMGVIFGGVLNMVFCKTPLYKKHKAPIDNYKCYKGKRLLGDNKTWIGFLGMVVSCMASQVIWGCICRCFQIPNNLYLNHENNLSFNIIMGACLGFIYMLFELPNSFIKRRLDIPSGKTTNVAFFIIDQIDSLIGVMLVLFYTSNITFFVYLEYVLLGGITHIFINSILYGLKIRKNL